MQTPASPARLHCGSPSLDPWPREGRVVVQRTFSLPFLLSSPVLTWTPALLLCRLLIAGTDSSDLQQILSLLEPTKDLLLTSSYLSNSSFTGKQTSFLVTQYLNATGSHWCSWSVSPTGVGEGQEAFFLKNFFLL